MLIAIYDRIAQDVVGEGIGHESHAFFSGLHNRAYVVDNLVLGAEEDPDLGPGNVNDLFIYG